MKTLSCIPFAWVLLSAPVAAQWRCDCTTITGTCSANVSLEPNFIEITADSAQCARVDYFVDGLPFVSVVVDGEAREDWITRSADPRVIVQGCQVCRDNAAATAPAARSRGPASPATAAAPEETPEAQDAPLLPLVAPQPTYPASAEQRGLEGYVTLEFVVNPFGDVASPRVVAAEPAGVFNLSALSAVSRWRYAADPEREPVTVTETVRFELDDFAPRSSAGAAPLVVGGSEPASGPLNQCLRENLSYNYGSMVEVGLIDACASPLIVFACAVGTGDIAQRWHCQTTESQNTVLVEPGDGRSGAAVAIDTGAIVREYRYSDRFFVARAPNTEYWWIACDADDVACRDEGRRWAAALDRQTASLDPRQRTRLPLGRSY